jgi:signal transduction histidine kinase
MEHLGAEGDRARTASLGGTVDLAEHERLERIAHELRAALTPLKGYLTLLTTGALNPVGPNLRDVYEVLLRQADRLELLAADVTEQAKGESSRRRMIVLEDRATAG